MIREFKISSGNIVRLSTHKTPVWMLYNCAGRDERFNRYLDVHECDFINCAIAATVKSLQD